MTRIEAPRGTHDILPAAAPMWHRVTGEAERLCALSGYRRIQTPGFEHTELFERTSGAGSDIVQKEMYTFPDRSGRSLTLRPEGTAPIVRAYLEHGLHREPQPQKLYTIAPMYRYSAPQRGRYREHWQLSVEGIGSPEPAIDAEIIHLYDTLLRNLGVREYTLELNSIGDENCRPAYLQQLARWLDEHDSALDDEARQKRTTSPLRVFDVKNPVVQAALADAPRIGDSLCDACRDHFRQVRAALDAYGVAYTLVPTLVRGLDYYTRTAWEFVGDVEGAQSSISGGGRYDGLASELGGPPTPGVGFGAGIERLILALEREGVTADPPEIDVFVVTEGEKPLELLAELRRGGLSADVDYAGRSLKGQLTQAQRLGARTTVVVEGDRATIRRRGESDTAVPVAELIARLTG